MTPDQIERAWANKMAQVRVAQVERLAKGVDDMNEYWKRVGIIEGLRLAASNYELAKNEIMGNTPKPDAQAEEQKQEWNY